MISFLKSHKTWLLTAAAGAVAFAEPSINAYVAGHPGKAIIFANLWAIATAWAKSPRQ
jgi:hypothetical protein